MTTCNSSTLFIVITTILSSIFFIILILNFLTYIKENKLRKIHEERIKKWKKQSEKVDIKLENYLKKIKEFIKAEIGK